MEWCETGNVSAAGEPDRPHRLPLRRKVLFLCLLLAGGGLCAEIAARAIDRWTYVSVAELRDVYQKRRAWRLGRYWPLQRGDYPYLPFVLNPDHPGINALGFKGEPISREKPPGTYRIVCLGGSTTFNGYPAYLEEALRDDFARRGLRLEVINAGNQCWTTMESLINFITRCLPLSPDAVVVYHAVNDVIYSFSDEFSPDYSNLRKRLEKDDPLFWDYLPACLDHSAAFVLFRAVFERKVGTRGIGIRVTRDVKDMKHRRFQGLEPFRQNLLTLASITEARGISLFLCTQVFNREAKKRHSLFDQWADAVDLANAITRSLDGYGGRVRVIDVAADLRGSNDWMTDFCHFTEEGKKRLAQRIAEGIRPYVGELVVHRPDPRMFPAPWPHDEKWDLPSRIKPVVSARLTETAKTRGLKPAAQEQTPGASTLPNEQASEGRSRGEQSDGPKSAVRNECGSDRSRLSPLRLPPIEGRGRARDP